jgi:hypothetical protein
VWPEICLAGVFADVARDAASDETTEVQGRAHGADIAAEDPTDNGSADDERRSGQESRQPCACGRGYEQGGERVKAQIEIARDQDSVSVQTALPSRYRRKEECVD